MALTHALHRLSPPLGLDLVVASVDHGLRPEAAAEVVSVRRLAEALGLDFRPLEVRIPPDRSTMAAARDARYAALRRAAERVGAARIAVGHTLDDQAETVLARLLRGADLEGLAGIAPRRRDGVVRPLIDCRSADVRAYLARHRLAFVEDPSNEQRTYERVRLRKDWLPALTASEDPRLAEHLAALADQARAVGRRHRRAGRRLLGRSRRGAGLGRARLRAASPAVRLHALRFWLAERERAAPAGPEAVGEQAVGRKVLLALDALITSGRGEVRLPGGRVARVREGALWLG